jgi:hypothetical protein
VNKKYKSKLKIMKKTPIQQALDILSTMIMLDRNSVSHARARIHELLEVEKSFARKMFNAGERYEYKISFGSHPDKARDFNETFAQYKPPKKVIKTKK